MPTTFYYSDVTHPTYSVSGFIVKQLLLGTRDDGAVTYSMASAASQPLQVRNSTDNPFIWVTEPIASNVTVSGTITHNLWGRESNAMANFGACASVWEYDNAGNSLNALVSTAGGASFADGVEYGTTSALRDWNATPTSRLIDAGNRLAVILYHGGIASPASGFTLDMTVGATTGGVSGDSFITFTETITVEGGAVADDPPAYTGGGYYWMKKNWLYLPKLKLFRPIPTA